MNSRRYWKNRLPFLLTNLVCMAALTVFLLVCGNPVSAVVLILIVWALILLTGLVLTYWKRKRQMKKLLDNDGFPLVPGQGFCQNTAEHGFAAAGASPDGDNFTHNEDPPSLI